MTRNLFITIHEGAGQNDPRGAVRGGATESDPSEPLQTWPDPSDPDMPLQTWPDPSDPDSPLQTWPDPSDPRWNQTQIAGGGSWGSVAAIQASVCPPPVSCCCNGKEQEAAAAAAAKRDYSGFVIVRLAAGIDLKDFETLWQLADDLGLTALKAALELRLGDDNAAPQLSENAARTQASREIPTVEGVEVLTSRPLIDVGGCRGHYGEAGEPVEAGACTRSEEIGRIRSLESRAALTSFRPLHSLLSYWRVDVRGYPERLAEVVQRLSRATGVDKAYAEKAARDPEAGTSGTAFDEDQGYLDDAPVGIGARWAWQALAGIQSSATSLPSVTICDLEQRWNLTHQDLISSIQGAIVGGANRADLTTDFGHHGTAVLGQLAAVSAPGNWGVHGAAQQIGSFRLASHYWAADKTEPSGQLHPFAGTSGHVASAIVNTLVPELGSSPPALEAGSVLLLEVQRGLVATEGDPADCDAIRLASALGVIVVEAAGNGGFDLDAYVDPDTGYQFNRRRGGFVDSGAVLVGAAWSALPHDRAPFSNYGSRLDCFAWGDSVTSCGYGDLDGDTAAAYYTNTFSGTSSASPIVAAAAALVQALHVAETDNGLSPREMRAVLADPATGTRQGPGVAGFIGVMPNLCAIAEQHLALVPDVYLRRSLCDDGSHPATGAEISSSPDVFLWSGPVNTVAQLVGEGPGANDPAPGEPEASTGQSLYIRLRNRGGGKGEAAVQLFTSPAATLITPERWVPIGEPLEVTDIPSGDTLVVSGPLPWTPPKLAWEQDQPAGEEPWVGGIRPPSSFLAVQRPTLAELLPFQGIDPTRGLPPGPPYFDWAEYRAFLRQQGVAWRNVYRVIPGGKVILPFLISGTPDRARPFTFEILRRLPAEVAVKLRVPKALAAKLRQRQPWLENGDVLLPRRCRVVLGRATLPARAGIRASLTVKFGDTDPASLRGHSLAIRQLWRGEEVGRITWWFGPGE